MSERVSEAAPLLGDERQTPSRGQRRRRRGPRSFEALDRRMAKYRKHCPIGTMGCGESQFPSSHCNIKLQPLRVFMYDVRRMRGKLTELVVLIRKLTADVILVQECWRDVSIEDLEILGFICFS